MPLKIFKQLFFNFPEYRQGKIQDFILTSANQLPYLYIAKWPEWMNNIVMLHGPSGCGKTFLANYWQQKVNGCNINLFDINEAQLEILLQENKYFIFDNFDKYFIRKYLMKNLDKHNFSSFEQSFLKIFEHLKSENKYMIITSTTEPTKLAFKTPDFASRIATVTNFDIAAPNKADLKTMIIKQFADLQLKVKSDIIELISENSSNSYVIAANIINDVNNLSLAEKRNINLNLVNKIINLKAA